MARRAMGLLVLTLSLLASAALFAEEPADIDRFASLLNQVSADKPDARAAGLREAGPLAKAGPEGLAQLSLLRLAAQEGLAARTVLIKAYASLADAPTTPRVYAASAALRCASLLAQDGREGVATLALGRARQLGRGDQIWAFREGRWTREDAWATTRRDFLTIQSTRLSYRALAWVAGLTKLEGSLRFLVSLFILFGILRILEAPFVIRIRASSNDTSNTVALLSLFVVDMVSVVWAQLTSPSWPFLFDLGRSSFLWLPSLVERDFKLTLLECAAGLLYLKAISSITRKPFPKLIFVFYVATTIVGYWGNTSLTKVAAATWTGGFFIAGYANLFWATLFVTSLGLWLAASVFGSRQLP
jgi:hypothetical protein